MATLLVVGVLVHVGEDLSHAQGVHLSFQLLMGVLHSLATPNAGFLLIREPFSGNKPLSVSELQLEFFQSIVSIP